MISQRVRRKYQLEEDKGYAWCILVMSCLSHCLHTGFLFGIVGNLTVIHKELFSVDIQQSGYIGSVNVGLFFIFAPLASVMIKKIGCGVTQLIGGAFLIIGFGLSAVTSKLWHAYIFYGLIAAFGYSCCYIASSEILSRYFKRYKYLAFALATLGTFIGMAVWPTITQNLIQSYGYHHAMGIIASFHITHVIAGISFVEPLNNTRKEATKTVIEVEAETKAEEKQPDVSLQGQPLEHSNNALNQESLKESFKKLLTSPKVWLLTANCFLWSVNCNSFFVLVNDLIEKSLSLPSDKVALGITILGISNIVGSITVLSLSRLKFDRIILHCTCSTVFGICTIAIALSIDKAMFYAFSALWGFAQGILLANLLAIVHEFCGANHLPLLFGINLFAEGTGSLIAAPLCSFVEANHTHSSGLILSGCFGILASLIIAPVIVYNYKYKPATDVSDNDLQLAQAPAVEEFAKPSESNSKL